MKACFFLAVIFDIYFFLQKSVIILVAPYAGNAEHSEAPDHNNTCTQSENISG